jgi:hypothetical protein
MLNVFRRSGLPLVQRREGSVIHLTLALGHPSISTRRAGLRTFP